MMIKYLSYLTIFLFLNCQGDSVDPILEDCLGLPSSKWPTIIAEDEIDNLVFILKDNRLLLNFLSGTLQLKFIGENQYLINDSLIKDSSYSIPGPSMNEFQDRTDGLNPTEISLTSDAYNKYIDTVNLSFHQIVVCSVTGYTTNDTISVVLKLKN